MRLYLLIVCRGEYRNGVCYGIAKSSSFRLLSSSTSSSSSSIGLMCGIQPGFIALLLFHFLSYYFLLSIVQCSF
jgi:hypothetical protein